MSKERTGCEARQYSDEWHCGRCGLQWDVNDDDPPRCLELQLKPNAVMTPTHPKYFKGGELPPDDPLAEARAILNR